MSTLSTHILDISTGTPAEGVTVSLSREGDTLATLVTNAQGRIATRERNWHDLFNAMVWARHPAIKHALNRQQCRHIAWMGPNIRNRAQQALTQFDETGVIVRVRNAALLELWDRHDWRALFEPQHWHGGDIAIAAVIGHALMEQMLVPGRLLVGKCVVVAGDDAATCVAQVAGAIAAGMRRWPIGMWYHAAAVGFDEVRSAD